ncbi:hypothetical protein DMUE_1904 [Dictyocoela muelleri]|nr:hypothetical protein DMUE_1904 [Dictyocoela muelleri]
MDRRQSRNPARGSYSHQRQFENMSNHPLRSRGRYQRDQIRGNIYERPRYIPYNDYNRYDLERPIRNNYMPRNPIRGPYRSTVFERREFSRPPTFNSFIRRTGIRQDQRKRNISKEELDESIKKYMRGEIMK